MDWQTSRWSILVQFSSPSPCVLHNITVRISVFMSGPRLAHLDGRMLLEWLKKSIRGRTNLWSYLPSSSSFRRFLCHNPSVLNFAESNMCRWRQSVNGRVRVMAAKNFHIRIQDTYSCGHIYRIVKQPLNSASVTSHWPSLYDQPDEMVLFIHNGLPRCQPITIGLLPRPRL